MMQRILNSKNLVAFVLAAATGMTLYFRVPFPEGNIFLRVMALRSPSAFDVLKYSYTLFLFSTPYIAYSVVFSGLYIFALKAKQRIRAGKLPLFPDPQKRDDLFLVLGEVHNPRKQVPTESPQWLVIPERGLFTGVAILGAIGSGNSTAILPQRILHAYCAFLDLPTRSTNPISMCRSAPNQHRLTTFTISSCGSTHQRLPATSIRNLPPSIHLKAAH